MNLHLDLFDLKLFAFVAEARSLTRGADKACISLAAASTRIKQMEESVGAKLLHRTAQGVNLTAVGQALLYHAKLVLQQMEHLRCDMQDFGKGVKGHVRVFANTTSITEYLPEKLAGFLVVIVTNQSGIGRGIDTADHMHAINDRRQDEWSEKLDSF